MNTPRKCPKCGAVLPDESPEGYCPGCLFMGAITPGDEPEPGAEKEHDVEPGRVSTDRELGDYELLEEIGRGGMGVVFKARQISLNRIVAIKMLLHGRFADPAYRRRFRLEAEAAAHLEHPNIVSIHEISEHAGQPFFSMQWVDGHGLDSELRGERISPQRSVGIMVKLARAVHHAHRHGVLHRDLKPHNVIIDAAGEPHLTDFGLAKLLESNTGLTMAETVLGSPGFMAPEQAAGKTGAITTAADIFSLGGILYMMLTGRPPFSGATPVATLQQVVECNPTHPRVLVPSLPRDLETICLKCLQKEPARRYGSAEALALDLERWQRNEPILARPVGELQRLWKWCRRQPLRAGLIAGLVVSILAGAVGVVSQWRRATAALAELERHFYAAQISVAQTHLENADLDSAREALADAGRESLRGWEWGWLQRECNQDLMTIPADGTVHRDFAFSAHGRCLITGGNDGDLRIWNLETHAPRKRISGNGAPFIHLLKLSPDGKTVVTIHPNDFMRVWDLEKEEIAYGLADDPATIAAAFSSDGSMFATGSADGRVQLRDMQSGAVIRDLATYESGVVMDVAFNPDGTQLAFCGGTVDPYNEPEVDLCILYSESEDGDGAQTRRAHRIHFRAGLQPRRRVDRHGRIRRHRAHGPDSRQRAAPDHR